MQRHSIGQQVQRSSAGSIPHDRIPILQICSSHSLPFDRPRQSAPRHPPVVTNRPTTYRGRRDPPLIRQPFHHPPACWSTSTPFTHLIRGIQIPIAHAAPPTSPSRGFLPGGLRTPAPRCTPRHLHGAAIRKPSHERSFHNFCEMSNGALGRRPDLNRVSAETQKSQTAESVWPLPRAHGHLSQPRLAAYLALAGA